jgi:hypothetical protein
VKPEFASSAELFTKRAADIRQEMQTARPNTAKCSAPGHWRVANEAKNAIVDGIVEMHMQGLGFAKVFRQQDPSPPADRRSLGKIAIYYHGNFLALARYWFAVSSAFCHNLASTQILHHLVSSSLHVACQAAVLGVY